MRQNAIVRQVLCHTHKRGDDPALCRRLQNKSGITPCLPIITRSSGRHTGFAPRQQLGLLPVRRPRNCCASRMQHWANSRAASSMMEEQMLINPRFQPVSTEFEVLATRNTRASLNGCYHGLHGGRGSDLRWQRELEGGAFLGFDPIPEQQVFAELAEMITMHGGNPAKVFRGFSPPNGHASNVCCPASSPMRICSGSSRPRKPNCCSRRTRVTGSSAREPHAEELALSKAIESGNLDINEVVVRRMDAIVFGADIPNNSSNA